MGTFHHRFVSHCSFYIFFPCFIKEILNTPNLSLFNKTIRRKKINENEFGGSLYRIFLFIENIVKKKALGVKPFGRGSEKKKNPGSKCKVFRTFSFFESSFLLNKRTSLNVNVFWCNTYVLSVDDSTFRERCFARKNIFGCSLIDFFLNISLFLH